MFIKCRSSWTNSTYLLLNSFRFSFVRSKNVRLSEIIVRKKPGISDWKCHTMDGYVYNDLRCQSCEWLATTCHRKRFIFYASSRPDTRGQLKISTLADTCHKDVSKASTNMSIYDDAMCRITIKKGLCLWTPSIFQHFN